MQVLDTAPDPRFQANPLVTGEPHIRFHAGAPLIVHGHVIGTLCAIDTQPRRLLPDERVCLRELAFVAQTCIERTAA